MHRKTHTRAFTVVSNHGNDVDSTIFSIETIDNSIVNINNRYDLEAEEILTDYDERLQREKNDSSYYLQCHYEKFAKVSVVYESTRDFAQ